MQQYHHTISCTTQGYGFLDLTHTVQSWIAETGIQSGLLTLLCLHTSASLTIQENADPDVLGDMTEALDRLAPQGNRLYRHNAEGPDDMPAHIKTSLTDASLSIPLIDGQIRLGTWQAVYLVEHRSMPHQRRIACHLIGE